MPMAVTGRGGVRVFLGCALLVGLALLPGVDAFASDPPPPLPAHAMARLHGRVVERGSGNPVAATVTVAGRTVDTAPDGTFAIDVPAGTHQVEVHSPGGDHRPLTVPQVVAGGVEVELVFRLDRFSWDEEVVVYGHDNSAEVSRTVFSADELGDVPASLGDPLRALQSLPAVARPAHLEGALVVRGAEAINTAAYIDEVPVPYLYHFLVGRSVVNPALLDEIAFYPGGMPSRYGGAAQAVVDARTLGEAPEHGLHGKVHADPLDFSASAEATVGEWFLQGGVRVAWIGALMSAGAIAYAQLAGLGNDRPGYTTLGYHDYLVRTAWSRGPNRLTLTAFGARDNLKWHEPEDGDVEEVDALPYDPDVMMNSGFVRVHLRWDHEQDGRRFTTWVAGGPEETTSLLEGIGRLTDGSLEWGRISGWTGAGRHETVLPVGPDGTLQLGGDVTVQHVVVEDYLEIEDGEALTTDDLVVSSGVWVEWQHRFGGLSLAPGVRGSLHQFNGQSRVLPEPRLSVRQKLTDHWDVVGSAGRYSQTPPPDRYAKGIGDPNIGLITAWQLSGGVEGHWSSGLQVEVTGYSTWMDGLVVPVDDARPKPTPWLSDPHTEDPTTGYHTFHETVEFQGLTGRAYGGEALIRLRPTRGWRGWASISAGRALRTREDGTTFVANHDLPFAVSLFGARQLPKAWQVAVKGQLTAGYPYTPEHGVYRSDWGYWMGATGEVNSARFPVFRQLDVRVEKTWTAKRARWTGSLDLHNVTNARNPILASYTPNYERLHTAVYVPFFPVVGLEVAY